MDDLKRQMEDASEAAEISEREMKEAAKEAEFNANATKSTASKSTAFLMFLVGVNTHKFIMF